MLFEARITLREMMDIIYAVNATRKIQHIKPLPAKVYQYLKKLDKNLEEAHFKSTLESLKMVILQCKEKQKKNQFFQLNCLKMFYNISNNVLLKTTHALK